MADSEELPPDERLREMVAESLKRTAVNTSDDLSSFLDCKNIAVSKVHLDGLKRTNRKHFDGRSIFKPVLASNSVENLIEDSLMLRNKLASVGVFKDVQITIDSSDEQPLLPNTKCLDLIFDCKEFRLLRGNVNFQAGSNELTGQTGIQLSNVFGRGESVSCGYSRSTTKSGSYSLDFTKLLSHDFNTVFKLSGIRSTESNNISQYDLRNTGFMTELSRPLGVWIHSLRYTGMWRNFHCPSWEAPFNIRLLNSGHSVFSSISHSLKYGTPGSQRAYLQPGLKFENKIELAGSLMGGDHKFVKHEANLKKVMRISDSARVSFSLNFGHLLPLDVNKPPSIVDRFFLGGPGSVRGFKVGGLGPSQNNCSFGGSTYWTSGLSLYTKMPYAKRRGGVADQFWLHVFVNAGNLMDNIDITGAYLLPKLGENFRYSYGAGIHWRFLNVACIEFNYCVPISIHSSDRLAPGFQFGVSIEVL